jgi:hypothetical protein
MLAHLPPRMSASVIGLLPKAYQAWKASPRPQGTITQTGQKPPP